MSTVPSLLDVPIDGPILDPTPLERDVAPLLERIVAARRDLAQIDAQRASAAKLLAEDLPTASAEARARLERAQQELEAYLQARVAGPIP